MPRSVEKSMNFLIAYYDLFNNNSWHSNLIERIITFLIDYNV